MIALQRERCSEALRVSEDLYRRRIYRIHRHCGHAYTTTCECYRVRRSHLVSLLTPDQAIGVTKAALSRRPDI